MMKKLCAFFAVFVVFSVISPVFAGENGQAYFSALPDVPLMKGMDEVEDQTFVFDKAEGRVIETAGFMSGVSPDAARNYYLGVLTQLGWKPLKNGVFARNDEQLLVNIEKVGEDVVVKFQLLPLSR